LLSAALLCATLAFWAYGRFAPARPGDAGPAADADYLGILALAYEQHAVRAYKRFWLEQAPELPPFHDGESPGDGVAAREACQLAARLCGDAIVELEHQQSRPRRRFVDLYRLDYHDHTPGFKGRHPERDSIFREIEELVNREARARAARWAAAIGAEYGNRRKAAGLPPGAAAPDRVEADKFEAEWRSYRAEFQRRVVPPTIDDLREKARGLPSLRGLSAAVR
jgi:hypothetical protein